MDRLAYTALSGMRSTMAAQAATANNLANASTAGFRSDLAAASAAAVSDGERQVSRIQSNERMARPDMTPGTLIATGNLLDVAVTGSSLIAVQAPEGGEAYTRRGDLRIGVSGLLVTGDGHPVLGEAGAITLPPAARIEIAADGTVAIQPEGAPETDLVPIARLKLVSPDEAELTRRADGLLGSDEVLAVDPDARVTAGALEGSNVNMAAALVDLVEQARAFEAQVGLVTAARELDEAGAMLLRHD